MNITVASGKGGTGKTTLAVNLAYLLAEWNLVSEPVRLLDCDVEEPNAHLFLPSDFTGQDTVHVLKPVIDEDKCTACGRCAASCRFNALAQVGAKTLLFPELCHSCGVCERVCPTGAITEARRSIGSLRWIENVLPFQFCDGLLEIGQPRAPALISALRRKYVSAEGITILDAPPGAACAVVETLHATDLAILVTEATPFGRHDLQIALELCADLRVPCGIFINRSDGEDELINDLAQESGVPVIGRWPFRRDYASAVANGRILIHEFPDTAEVLESAWKALLGGARIPEAGLRKALSAVSFEETDSNKGLNRKKVPELLVLSGKGGTGKTCLTASLAVLAEEAEIPLAIADCDVDAADLHLLLTPQELTAEPVVNSRDVEIDSKRCIGCGACLAACHFDAIELLEPDAGTALCRIDPLRCEACGLCSLVCPVGAVDEEPKATGQWFRSETCVGPMLHARLEPGEENSGQLVSKVRKESNYVAEMESAARQLVDGPPGIACPVIAALSGVEQVLIVTEPSLSGRHDLERVLELARHFGVESRLIINRADLAPEISAEIRVFAAEKSLPIIGEIPFDPEVLEAVRAGCAPVLYGDGPASSEYRKIWKQIEPIPKV